jgi:hypothetical protein
MAVTETLVNFLYSQQLMNTDNSYEVDCDVKSIYGIEQI